MVFPPPETQYLVHLLCAVRVAILLLQRLLQSCICNLRVMLHYLCSFPSCQCPTLDLLLDPSFQSGSFSNERTTKVVAALLIYSEPAGKVTKTTITSCVAAPATAIRIGDTGSGLLSPNSFGDQISVFSASANVTGNRSRRQEATSGPYPDRPQLATCTLPNKLPLSIDHLASYQTSCHPYRRTKRKVCIKRPNCR